MRFFLLLICISFELIFVCVCVRVLGVKPSFYLGLLQRVNAVNAGLYQKLIESASSHTISRQITIDKTNEDDYGISLLHLTLA